MLKIGDFSKLSQVSIKTLRHYDQLGLLKPIQVDPESGYRYYTASQLIPLSRILAYKDLGLSLAQIGRLVQENLSTQEVRGMLKLRQAELQQQVQIEQARLERIAAHLHHIEQEDTMPDCPVLLKPIPPLTVVSIREILPEYAAVGQLYGEIYQFLAHHQIKPSDYRAAIWHDQEYKEADVDGEAVVGLTRSDRVGNDRIRIHELPGFESAATLIHQGSYRTLQRSYHQIMGWVEDNGYQFVGPDREVYIVGGNEPDDESYVTEIQFPVAKVASMIHG